MNRFVFSAPGELVSVIGGTAVATLVTAMAGPIWWTDSTFRVTGPQFAGGLGVAKTSGVGWAVQAI